MNQRQYFPGLDILRAVAILLVLIAHFFQPVTLKPIIKELPFNYGVNLFFVLSGFLITLGLLKNVRNEMSVLTIIKEFFVKRVLRIFPIYFLFLGVLLWLNYENIQAYAANLLTFTYNLAITPENIYDNYPFIHFWSLSVEEQFYLFWPFIIIAFRKKGIQWVFGILIIISILFKVYLFLNGKWVQNMYGLTANTFHLAAGSSLAYFYLKQNSNLWNKLKWILLLIGAVSSIASLLIHLQLTEFKFNGAVLLPVTFTILFTGFVALLVNHQSKIYDFVLIKPFIFIGKISYGIYLYHLFAGSLVFDIPILKNFLTSNARIFLIQSLSAIVFATASWYLIERPILKLKRRLYS